MSPKEFDRELRVDSRLNDGGYFPTSPLVVKDDDVIGLVLLVSGSPERQDDIREYLYRQYMDPAGHFMGGTRVFQSLLSRLRASRRATSVKSQLEAVGGGSALNLLIQEQAECIRRKVETKLPKTHDLRVESYIASRYGLLSSLDVIEKMKADGVTKVVLIPLFPQYARSTTGSAFAFWHGLSETGRIPNWETTCIHEFSTQDGYARALSDRIDQALQRFPRDVRHEVHLLFVAQGSKIPTRKNRDPYCCLLHHTMEKLMSVRNEKRTSSIAYMKSGPGGEWLSPSAQSAVQKLSRIKKAILAIPLDIVTEQLDTAFGLDVELRAVSIQHRIAHYHVASGLNCHPLFIDSLSNLVLLRLRTHASESDAKIDGDLSALEPCRRYSEMDAAGDRRCRCHICPFFDSDSIATVISRTVARTFFGRSAV